MGTYFLGIDLGTSGIKAGIVDETGAIISDLYWDTDLTASAPGRMEQDTEAFYFNTLKIIKAVVEQSGLGPGDIAAVAVDGQMGGVIGIDKGFSSLTGLDMGLDIRSEKYNARMHADEGKRLAALTCGSPRNTPKIMRWKEEQPDVYAKIVKFVTLSGYVVGKMAGLSGEEAFIDYTLLSFFGNEDAKILGWSKELTRAFDLDMEKLPRVVDPWQIVGVVTAETASASGLRQGTPIMAGAGDQPAGLLGGGFVHEGALLDVSGSTTLLIQAVDSFVPDTERHAVMYMPSVIKGKYSAFTYINGGGIALKWYRDQFARGLEFSELTELAREVDPGSEGLLFIPYFGGRQCPYNPELRGGWIGLNWGHKREHMFRAVLEGLAYDYALGREFIQGLFPDIEVRELSGTGGGARNEVWNKIKADILGLPYASLGEYQFALRGCAIIAGYSLGIFTDLLKTSQTMNENNERRIVQPDPPFTEQYRKYYSVFKKAFHVSLEEVMSDLCSLG